MTTLDEATPLRRSRNRTLYARVTKALLAPRHGAVQLVAVALAVVAGALWLTVLYLGLFLH